MLCRERKELEEWGLHAYLDVFIFVFMFMIMIMFMCVCVCVCVCLCLCVCVRVRVRVRGEGWVGSHEKYVYDGKHTDRKSTRLNSSHRR